MSKLSHPITTAIGSIVVSIVAATGGYIASTQEAKVADSNIVQSAFERTKFLETRLFEAQTELVKLKISRAEIGSEGDAVKELMRKDPSPSFIKLISNPLSKRPNITNWYINPAYERQFGYARERYFGKTDYQVWGVEVGNQFYLNDLYSLRTRVATCIKETFPSSPRANSELITANVCKWVFKMDGHLALYGEIRSEFYYDKNVVPKSLIQEFIDEHNNESN